MKFFKNVTKITTVFFLAAIFVVQFALAAIVPQEV